MKLTTTCLFLFVVTWSFSQSDVEGSQDHPLFPTRIPGYYIETYEASDFSVGTFRNAKGEDIQVSGKKTTITYRLKPGSKAASSPYITLNFQAAAKKLKPIVEYLQDGNGRFDAEIKNSTADSWISVSSYLGEGTPELTETYILVIVEKSLMDQVISAADISSNIKSSGHVALYILFDTGLATIKSESKNGIEQIALTLKKDPALKVFIVGHTDNQGNFESNLKLSVDRANAVVLALTSQFGIPASQLVSKGVGSLCPVSTNETEEGRKQNRRVELVKM
ncbi:MAG: OmpA family protein [Bacteroidetes bacterium]|nr:OmpA family protein [Bacteroidota bacterium]